MGAALFLFHGAYAEEPKSPESTRIVINTSGSVAYRHVYQSHPPRITLRFFHNTVYSRIQESIPIQKGIVKGIEATYFKEGAPGAKKPLKSLTFNLLAETTYEVFDGPHSIILVIRHPKEVSGSDLITGKVTLTALPITSPPSEVRQEELSEALRQAMSKISPRTYSDSSLAQREPPASSVPPQSVLSKTPWYHISSFHYGTLCLFLLGGLFWFFVQDRTLRREKRRSWEMAKRIIALKEESVSYEAKARALEQEIGLLKEVDTKLHETSVSHESKMHLLEEEIAHLKGTDATLQQESKILLKEKEILQKELERGTSDLHELAAERVELSDRLQAVQSALNEKEIVLENLLKELRDLSARYDQEIAHRRELETALEELRSHRKKAAPEAGEEQRRFTRLPILPIEKQDVPLTVEVQGPSGRLIYGYPKNVSLGGIAFELKEKVELPNSLSLTLFFPKKKSGLATQGRVVWKIQNGASSRYGVCFVDLAQSGSDLISQFIKERLPLIRDANRMFEESLKEKTAQKTVTFTLNAPDAKSVAVVGDFDGWDPEMHLMKKMKEGVWKAALLLPPGSYQYQFYVDGIWQADPSAQTRLPNPFGGENTLLEIS